MNEISYIDIKVENPIKPEVRNFLTSGKTVKMLFKQLKNNETFNIDDIFEILTKFDPSKDEFCENIEYPKNNQVYLHYSTDDKKVLYIGFYII